MSRHLTILLACVAGLIYQSVSAQTSFSGHRVIALSNLSDQKDPAAVVRQLDVLINPLFKNTLLITGDLLMQGENAGSERIKNFLDAAEELKVEQIIFIPGDRDWDNKSRSGYEKARELELVFLNRSRRKVRFIPEDGCPGPEEIKLDDHLILLTVNTQWWNHIHSKPYITHGDCPYSLERDFFEEFEDIISDAGNKNILIAGHHPVKSLGQYGGRFPLRVHLFPLTELKRNLYVPLPFIGTAYVAYRQNIGSGNDIINKSYEPYKEGVEKLLRMHNNLVYLSGHEEGLQVIRDDDHYHISTGSVADYRYVNRDRNSLYVSRHPSLVILDYKADGSVVAVPVEVNGQPVTKDSLILYSSPCSEIRSDAPVNKMYSPCRDLTAPATQMKRKYPEVHLVAAGPEYKARPFKKLMLGSHYRSTWTTPVSVPFLDLDTTFGGLTPVETGGGRQTTSLRFEAADGSLYNFRSVNKDPTRALEPDLRNTMYARLFKDQTSTQHPYGALAADVIQRELGILHPSPKLYLLPDDPKLGEFRKDFAELFGMLEEHPKSPDDNRPGFAGADKLHKSYNMFRRRFDSPRYQLDEHAFATARLFDILSGDWGRHADNWRWAMYEDERGMRNYYPVPRDRDHIFSRWDGLVPWFLDRKWAVPDVEHFGAGTPDLKTLTGPARHLDRMLLTSLNRQDWERIAERFKAVVTDSLIEEAVRNMPSEVHEKSGKEVERKLKSRMKRIDRITTGYYNLLAKQVDVTGTNEDETFEVVRESNGDVSVTVFTSYKDSTFQFYRRRFVKGETDEIRLYGLGGNDKFNLTGESRGSIPVRIIPGDGENQVTDSSRAGGSAKTLVYDRNHSLVLVSGPSTRRITNARDEAYRYRIDNFRYNTYRPVPAIGFNADDGFSLGMGVEFTRQKYGKPDYHRKHYIGGSVSTMGFYDIVTYHEFHESIGKADLLLGGALRSPGERRFFYGLGNESAYRSAEFNRNDYLIRNTEVMVGAGIQQIFFRQSAVRFFTMYNYFNPAQLAVTVNEMPFDIPVRDPFTMITGLFEFDLDFRDNQVLPTRGLRFYSAALGGNYLDVNYKPFIRPEVFLNMNFSNHWVNPVTLELTGGGSKIAGDGPLSLYPEIGQRSGLRGYRINRFTGDAAIYGNSEIRWTLGNFPGNRIPFRVGVAAFADAGRVYMNGSSPGGWHYGVGPGVFLMSKSGKMAISGYAGFSREERFLITIGTRNIIGSRSVRAR